MRQYIITIELPDRPSRLDHARVIAKLNRTIGALGCNADINIDVEAPGVRGELWVGAALEMADYSETPWGETNSAF